MRRGSETNPVALIMLFVIIGFTAYFLIGTFTDWWGKNDQAIKGLTDCGSGLATGVIFGENTVHGACDTDKACTNADAQLRRELSNKFPEGGRMQYVGEGWGCPPKEDDKNEEIEQRKYCCIVLGGEENPVPATVINNAKTTGTTNGEENNQGIKCANLPDILCYNKVPGTEITRASQCLIKCVIKDTQTNACERVAECPASICSPLDSSQECRLKKYDTKVWNGEDQICGKCQAETNTQSGRATPCQFVYTEDTKGNCH